MGLACETITTCGLANPTTAPGSGEPLLLPPSLSCPSPPPPNLSPHALLTHMHYSLTCTTLSHAPHTTGELQIYQARITNDLARTEVWRVEGVATVEIGGTRPPSYVFDCNTTLNNGSGVGWTRLDGSLLGLTQRALTNGKRLDAGVLAYQNLGNYSCWDERTGERLTLMITDSKNTDRIKNRKKFKPSFLLLALINRGGPGWYPLVHTLSLS